MCKRVMRITYIVLCSVIFTRCCQNLSHVLRSPDARTFLYMLSLEDIKFQPSKSKVYRISVDNQEFR